MSFYTRKYNPNILNIGKLKVDVTDTTFDFLGNKLVAGSGITLIVNNPGGNETITISSSGGGSQTPWASTINAAGYPLTDINSIIFGTGVGALPVWSGNLELIDEQYVSSHFRGGGFQFDTSGTVGNIDWPHTLDIGMHKVGVNNGSFNVNAVTSNSTGGASVDTDASFSNQTNIEADSSFTINNPYDSTNYSSNLGVADGQKYIWRVKNVSGGDPITVTLDTQFRFGGQVTSIADIQDGETAYIMAIWNDNNGTWDVLSNPNGYN